MSSLISVDEEEGVAGIDKTGAIGAVRDPNALTVPSYQETVNVTCITFARQTSLTFMAWVSKSAFGT